MDKSPLVPSVLVVMVCTLVAVTAAAPQESEKGAALDTRVRSFLESHADDWHDMNVPETDGKLLYDLILKNNYKDALEIGTSTGRSAIWMAWALSKTGGKLITIEIDESRYEAALRNFKEAGLSGYVDARRANAHKLIASLDGPFDFVFNDADKEWYRNYFVAVSPKLKVGGCFAAHNVSMREKGIREFLEYVKGLPNYETTIDSSSRAGVSISCKRSAD